MIDALDSLDLDCSNVDKEQMRELEAVRATFEAQEEGKGRKKTKEPV